MKTITLSEKAFASLHKFLGRADLKGNEVPEFLQVLQELRARTEGESNPADSIPNGMGLKESRAT